MTCACICVIAGGIFTATIVHNNNIEKSYNASVDCILKGDFKGAEEKLKYLDYRDSVHIKKFCNLMTNMKEYCGRPKRAKEDMEAITGIENNEVNKIKKGCNKELITACDVQNEIKALDVEDILKDTKKCSGTINKVKKDLSQVDKAIIPAINANSVELMSKYIQDIENSTPVGKTLTAIDSIGEVKLSSKESIDKAKNLYNSLTEEDKAEVFNAKKLISAESTYKELEIEEQNRRAKEEEERARLKDTVYVTATGDCYHYAGCRFLRSKIKTTREKAEKDGYRPCEVCCR